MIKNTLPDKSGIMNTHSRQGFAEGVLQVVLFTVLWFEWLVQHCVAKVLLAICEIFSHENNRNYNSYIFSYEFAFIHFLCFLTNKTRTRFSASWWSSNEKYFCFLFVASRILLQRYAKFNRFLQRNFLTRYSCSYYSSVSSGKQNSIFAKVLEL